MFNGMTKIYYLFPKYKDINSRTIEVKTKQGLILIAFGEPDPAQVIGKIYAPGQKFSPESLDLFFNQLEKKAAG
jgi:hypothetical protein